MKRSKKYYFLENKEWYSFNNKTACYEIAKNAPEEAQKSFNEYIKERTTIKYSNGRVVD